jgi:hypothetical protein
LSWVRTGAVVTVPVMLMRLSVLVIAGCCLSMLCGEFTSAWAARGSHTPSIGVLVPW